MSGSNLEKEWQMRMAWTAPLFAWEALEDSPSLRTVREFLSVVPDGRLLESLRKHRGHGRNDYPVQTLWGVLLVKTVLRHETIEGCLGELCRNEGLRRLIGIQNEEGVPKKWNVSRFLEVLGQEPHWTLLQEVFSEMVRRLASVVPDLGAEVVGDASGLSARPGSKKKGSRLPQATGGRKEYVNDQGVVVEVVEWFGFKFHLLVDKRHEVVLAWTITSANRSDNEELPWVLEQAEGRLPEKRIKTLAYDKGADDGEIHTLLCEKKIAPVIENRHLWKDQIEQMLPGTDGRSNVVYDESGTLYCYDKESDPPVRHKMAYIGHEPSRGTLKYRCPAMHQRWKCPSLERCNCGRSYGMTVRVKRDIDLRRFPEIPRATKKFERLYRGRTSVERVNARLKVFWGADDGNITGSQRFHGTLGVVMLAHIGLATLLAASPRPGTTLGTMHLGKIAKALRPKLGLQ
jgi:hypothetical protein